MIALTEDDCCKHKSDYPFSSLQYSLPKMATRKIIQWGEANIDDKDIYTNPDEPQYGREYESHVTVIYGIHEEDPHKIKKVIGKYKPFHVEFGKVSVFNCPKFEVAKIEVESLGLRRINKLIQDNFEITQNANAYRPHVTIAFLKKGSRCSFAGCDEFVGNKLFVDRLTFSSKNGVLTTVELNS
jgi:hypothetical protein